MINYHGQFPFAILFLALAPVSLADVISGTVTDFDNQAPLSGVKVSYNPSVWTLTAEDGSYTLNSEAVALFQGRSAMHGRPEDGLWDAMRGRYLIPGSKPGVTFELRNLKGSWIAPMPWGNGAGQGPFFRFENGFGPLSRLAKTAATNRLTYEKSGYMNAVQQWNGSQSKVDIRLKKGSLTASKSELTWYTSYPDPNSEECIKYNGCNWAGQFAALNGVQPESWVKANNIIAVHSKDFNTYKLKTLRITSGYRQIDAKVYDMCSDTDCDGCCTQNAQPSGFLIDMESHTAERFGLNSGQIDWVCLDCP